MKCYYQIGSGRGRGGAEEGHLDEVEERVRIQKSGRERGEEKRGLGVGREISFKNLMSFFAHFPFLLRFSVAGEGIDDIFQFFGTLLQC